MATNKSILVGGGRTVTPSSTAGLACAQFAATYPGVINTGCATGADQIALQHGARVNLYVAFAQSGAGSFRGSNINGVQIAACRCLSVHWLAGGGLQVPLVARLMSRSIAALAGCSSAVFFAPGIGSLKVARAALKAGIPVFVSCAGMASAPVLPVPARRIAWQGLSFWQYAPAKQASLF